MSAPSDHTSTATLQPTAGERETVRPVIVEATDGPGKGPSVRLERGTLLVGSEPGCDLVIADKAVSRQHLRIEHLGVEVRVTDLGSRNGTKYLGARIAAASVPIGGSVRIGKTTLRISPVVAPSPLSDRSELHGLVAHSSAMRRLVAQLERLAEKPTTVLLQGETGVGKGAVARALHLASPRAAGPFVVFDCAAQSPELIESALFGHVPGAFTGATEVRSGAVEQADEGTLFFDEIGDLPLALQPKLLRLLEERTFVRLGDGHVRQADIRVVAATHKPLAEEVRQGRFRQDLYYRLAVTEVTVPPLRERPEDIPVLARHFAMTRANVDVPLDPATIAAFQCARWPGNVRELRNEVERVLTLGETAPETPASPETFIAARDKALDRFERDYLAALLDQHQGNASAAARAAKLARSHFYRLLSKHGLVGRGDVSDR